MEISEPKKLQGQWPKLDEVAKQVIQDLRVKKSEAIYSQKFESIQATLMALDQARKIYLIEDNRSGRSC
jgi:hypothetical protein